MELLIIEDNRHISEFLVKGLKEIGFSVSLAETAADARRFIDQKTWDLMLLDIMLPDSDGIELLRYVRSQKILTPVLVLSALGEPDDKIKGLNCGADDYLAKPFHFNELLARIHALLRRAKQDYDKDENILRCNDLTLYVDKHLVERNGKDIKLTLQEFMLLKLLMENKNKVLSRSEILAAVWDIHFNPNTNIVDVYISYLRNKIDAGNEDKLIETVKGRGYVIRTKE